MKKLSIIFFIVLSFTNCSRSSSKQDWYLKGGDIHLVLDWPEKHILLEDSSGMIFSGIILSQTNKAGVLQIHIRIENVGELYKDKYPQETRSDFVIWLEYTQNNSLKVIINQISTKPYFFVQNSVVDTFTPFKQGRFLSEGEIKSFLKNNNANLSIRYITNILTDKLPKLDMEEVTKAENNVNRRWLREKYKISNSIIIKEMVDYLKDTDPSTAFITQEEAKKLRLEYILNNSSDSELSIPLKQAAGIRAILINTGNLDNKQDFRKYRRPKSLKFYFSNQYSGGLGSTKGSYNEESLIVNLTDEPKTHLIVFYQSILAKVISVNVDSYYLGDRDEMALYDLVFYGDAV